MADTLNNYVFVRKRTHTKVRFSQCSGAAIFVQNSGLATYILALQANDGTS